MFIYAAIDNIIITKNHGKIPYFLTTSNIIIKHIRNIVLKWYSQLINRNYKYDFEHCFFTMLIFFWESLLVEIIG